MNGNQGKAVECMRFTVARRRTMIAESGVGRIIEVDKDGKITRNQAPAGSRQHTRKARKLANGNYLVVRKIPAS